MALQTANVEPRYHSLAGWLTALARSQCGRTANARQAEYFRDVVNDRVILSPTKRQNIEAKLAHEAYTTLWSLSLCSSPGSADVKGYLIEFGSVETFPVLL